MKKTVWITILVLGVAGLIFFLSSMSYERQSIVPMLENLLPTEFIEDNFSGIEFKYGNAIVSVEEMGAASFIEFFLRKSAHFGIFASLAIVLFLFSKRWFSTKNSFIISLVIAVGYASIDEFHQGFTPGRSPLWQDVVIDSFGALFGLVLVTVILNKLTKKEHKNKEYEVINENISKAS